MGDREFFLYGREIVTSQVPEPRGGVGIPPGRSSSMPMKRNCSNCKEQFNANELDQKVLDRGDVLTFELENHSRQENFYCYLMDIDSKGRVEFVFPSNGDDKGKIYVNGKKTVRDFILVDVTGEETVKLLVTKQEIDYESLTQTGYAERGAAQKGARNPLYQILAEASEGESFRTRGPLNDEWFSEQFTFVGK